MSTLETSSSRRKSIVLLAMVVLGLLIRLLSLGDAALTDPSEGRYAVMGQNMYLSGDWLTPRVYQDGELVPFLGKPPLHAWATATSYALFGINEFAARFPSFLASALVVFAVFLLALQSFGMEAAALSALLLLSSWLFFFLGNSCLTDPLLMLFVSLSMFSMGKLLFGKKPAEGPIDFRNSPWAVLFFVFLSCGMMVKGPIAIAIPGVALGLWALLTKRIKQFFTLPFLKGAGIFFLIVAPWYILAERANPGFLWYFFVNENLLRFLVKNYGDRYGSGHVYVYGTIWFFLISGFLPGAFLVLSKAFRQETKKMFSGDKREEFLFALCWTVAPAIIFTFSRQISPSYVLPGLPGLALLCGPLLQRTLSAEKREELSVRLLLGLKVIYTVLCLLVIAGIIFSAGLKTAFASLILIGLLSLASFWLKTQTGDREFASVCISLLAMVLLFSGVTMNISPLIEGRSSSRSVVEYVEHTGTPVSTLGFLGAAPHSAYFYSREPEDNLSVVRVQASELAQAKVSMLVARAKDLAEVQGDGLARFHEVAKVGKWVVFSSSGPASEAQQSTPPQNPEIPEPSQN